MTLRGYRSAVLEWAVTTGLAESTASIRRRSSDVFILWCDERGLDRPQDISQLRQPVWSCIGSEILFQRLCNGDVFRYSKAQYFDRLGTRSPAARYETGALELAIGTIGIGRSETSTAALINLLGLRLDGAGSEEWDCQDAVRGQVFVDRMARSQTKQIFNHCASIFMMLGNANFPTCRI